MSNVIPTLMMVKVIMMCYARRLGFSGGSLSHGLGIRIDASLPAIHLTALLAVFHFRVFFVPFFCWHHRETIKKINNIILCFGGVCMMRERFFNTKFRLNCKCEHELSEEVAHFYLN